MLQGFDNKALVIYPLADDYYSKGLQYENHIRISALNVQKYLKLNNVYYDCFVTDDIAREIRVSPDRWVATLNQGDMFFVKNNCEDMFVDFANVVTNADVIKSTQDKYPNERGLGVERRFELVLKRDSMARREILKTYKIVILFKQPKSPAMRFVAKPGSGIMYIEIDNSSFLAKCFMSDTLMDTTELLGIKNGYMPAYEWEVN